MRLMLAAAAAVVMSSAATAAPARTAGDVPVAAMPNPGALPDRCVKRDRLRVKGRNEAGPGKLGDMPPADQIKTIYRSADGCPDPLVVRRAIGTPKAAAARPGG